MRSAIRSAAAVLALSTALAGCSGSAPGASDDRGSAEGCVDGYVEGEDYFADKSTVEESELWDIAYHGSYKTITLTDTEDAGADALTYVLYQCGTPQPEAEGELSDALFVEVPVTSVAVTSFNALAMVDRLGQNGTVTGLSGQLLASAEVDDWYAGVVEDAGGPTSVGEYTDLDREALLGQGTQAVFMSGFGQGFDDVSNARAAGLPGVSVSNRMERHALASAEWIKMVGAFYNAEAAANAEYDAIASRFGDVVSTVSGEVDDRQAGYLCVVAERGCEFVYAHGEQTLVGRLLDQLGADNVFARDNDGPNGRAYDFEEALGAAADADFFVVYDPMASSAEALAGDERLEEFRPLREGDYLVGVDENFEECRAKTYLDVDVLIRDFALGLAPELFPDETGTCFTRAS